MTIRFLLAQINTTVGDIEGNLAKAIESLRIGSERNVDVVVLPEQTLTGYPARDLVLLKSFVRRNEEALQRFALETKNMPAALISFTESHTALGAGLYNSAAFCRSGVVEKIYRKWLLPTYDVFDEDRYFDEGRGTAVVDVKGVPVGITICEDLWNDEIYWSHRRYERDPIDECVKAGARIVLNTSASPFTLGKRASRRDMISSMARRHGVPILQCNAIGGNDDIIFDGSSVAYSGRGEMIAEVEAFTEDHVVVDVEPGDAESPAIVPAEMSELEELRRALTLGLRDYVGKCGFKSVVLGLSGGIDSALVAALAVEALGSENVHGISMPSRYSSEHSKADAKELAEALGIRFTSIPIESMFSAADGALSPHLEGLCIDIAKENMQARLRGLTLMSLSNSSGSMVLTTGNKSELSVGYCTLYGDMCGGLAVIADVPKLMVYKLSHYLNERAGRMIIPMSTLTKAPSAELAPNQKDSDSLPPYEILDPIIQAYVEEALDEDQIVERGYDRPTVTRVLRLINLSEYKRRQAPPALKVTSRAFGTGWRMPIARK